jgi:hypothetical protein
MKPLILHLTYAIVLEAQLGNCQCVSILGINVLLAFKKKLKID